MPTCGFGSMHPYQKIFGNKQLNIPPFINCFSKKCLSFLWWGRGCFYHFKNACFFVGFRLRITMMHFAISIRRGGLQRLQNERRLAVSKYIERPRPRRWKGKVTDKTPSVVWQHCCFCSHILKAPGEKVRAGKLLKLLSSKVIVVDTFYLPLHLL